MNFTEDQDFLRSIRTHFVSMCGTYVALNETGRPKDHEQAYCYSGFIIEIRGVWCLVTAGHVFHQIDNFLNNREIKLLKCGLADYYGQNAILKEPLPFPYADQHRIAIDGGPSGLDIGLIPLRDYFRMNLEANGVKPLPVAEWQSASPPSFEFYALLGLAHEDLEPCSRMGERGPQIGLQTCLKLVGVKALLSPPEDRIRSPVPQFAGVLCDGNALTSVQGMSGGPILGITQNDWGGWEYACVAVQGSWHRPNRMLFGTPVSIVVDEILKLLPS